MLTSSRKRSGVPNGCYSRLVCANGLLAFLSICEEHHKQITFESNHITFSTQQREVRLARDWHKTMQFCLCNNLAFLAGLFYSIYMVAQNVFDHRQAGGLSEFQCQEPGRNDHQHSLEQRWFRSRE